MSDTQCHIVTGRLPAEEDAEHDPHGLILAVSGGCWHLTPWWVAAEDGITTFLPLPPIPTEQNPEDGAP